MAKYFRIDMHNHTFFSPDSTSDPIDFVERAIEIGLNGVAVTEHNSFLASEPFETLKDKYDGRIRIFRGVEYSSHEGHVLIFGIKDDSFITLGVEAPIREVIKYAGEKNAVIVLPHPFREWSLLRSDIGGLQGVSAIEAYNGHNNKEENAKALIEANRLGLPTTGGSDSHNIAEIGSCFTEFHNEITYDNFLDELRKGRYRGICSADA